MVNHGELPPFHGAMGTGKEVLTGNIGCLSGKMKFGCMGDPVNLARGLSMPQ